jgi:hypothetical protein
MGCADTFWKSCPIKSTLKLREDFPRRTCERRHALTDAASLRRRVAARESVSRHEERFSAAVRMSTNAFSVIPGLPPARAPASLTCERIPS